MSSSCTPDSGLCVFGDCLLLALSGRVSWKEVERKTSEVRLYYQAHNVNVEKT